MESETSLTKIDKLNHSNYHFLKIRVQHVLTLKDLETFLEEDPPQETESPLMQFRGGRRKTEKLTLSLASLCRMTYSKCARSNNYEGNVTRHQERLRTPHFVEQALSAQEILHCQHVRKRIRPTVRKPHPLISDC